MRIRQLFVCALFGCTGVVGAVSLWAQDPQSARNAIAKIDEAEATRENHLAGYTVIEHYEIFHNGDNTQVGDAKYKVTYVKGEGKTYEPIGEPVFHGFLVKLALKAMIQEQQKLSKPPLRASVIPNSDNYEMKLLDEGQGPNYICKYERPSRDARVLKITPRNPSKFLIEGHLWFDTTNYHIVRIEGRFSEKPNPFIGLPLFERDYEDRDGFAIASSSCQATQSTFSHYWSRITYENYVITRDTEDVKSPK